jgi:hypothetical protein
VDLKDWRCEEGDLDVSGIAAKGVCEARLNVFSNLGLHNVSIIATPSEVQGFEGEAFGADCHDHSGVDMGHLPT